MNEIKTSGNSSMVKTVVVGVVGAVASYLAVSFTKKLLEEKPLKTRLREGKAKIVDIKDTAVSKAQSFKDVAKDKVGQVAAKTKTLIDDKIDQAENKLDKVEDKLDQADKM